MTATEIICITIAVICIIIAAFAMVKYRAKTGKTLQRLTQMVDSAIDGSFEEHSFDESRLSALESKLNDYLSASAVSSRNLAAEKDKIKELIADISHQTKTPISNILLYAQLLAEQELTPQGSTCVDALRQQSEKLSFLISSLVKLSRLETGILTLNPKQTPLGEMLENIKSEYLPKAEEKGIALAIYPSDEQAVFDPKWTAEAVGNIVDNAVKYTNTGGKVEIGVTAYELFCRIDVADTGIGIAEDEHPKVFSRFYRSSAVSEHEGVGVGLYLSNEIITGQGGYIKVKSAPGDGSVFSVFLPR